MLTIRADISGQAASWLTLARLVRRRSAVPGPVVGHPADAEAAGGRRPGTGVPAAHRCSASRGARTRPGARSRPVPGADYQLATVAARRNGAARSPRPRPGRGDALP